VSCGSNGTRTRICNSPTPACGGTACLGSSIQSCSDFSGCPALPSSSRKEIIP
jgi:hypothetical protein